MRRPRLVARLRERPDARVALLVAPAGYGKTTLLSEWAEEDERPFAWITLVEADNDPALLLVSIVGALETIEPIASDVLAALSVPKPSISGVVLARLARSLSERRPFVLVLDDAQVLNRGESFELLSGIAEHLPPGAQLALGSRTEPPLPLGRLRAHRLLAELHQSDLAMTRSEGAKLLEAIDLRLDPADQDTLIRHTEGWPAALYLAGLSLTDQPDVGRAVARFAGDDRVVADYLRDEFLSRTSPGALEFLTRTSVLDVLSGPLCDAVLERSGSARLLRDLARSNMLLVSLDRRDESYRYHALFAEMLRSELRRLEPGIEPELHRRASTWYMEHEDPDAGISHAIAAGDTERAGSLIWEIFPQYVARGRNATLHRWLDRFTDEQIAACPPLALTAAGAWLTNGDGARAEHWTSTAAAGLDRMLPEQAEALRSNVAIFRAQLARDGVVQMGRDAARAAALEPEDSPWQAVCCLVDGAASHLTGDRERARAALEDGARRGAVGAPTLQALCLAQLSLLATEQGDREEGARLVTQARALVERCGLADYESMALLFAVSALARAHEGRVDEATADVQRSTQMLDLLTDFPPWYEAETRLVLARARLRLDDVEAARTYLSEASRLLRSTPDATALRDWLQESWAAVDSSSAAVASGRWGLTPAELRVLQFLPTHLSFREIAERLHVSTNTVKTQARAVYRKLDVSSRAEAVEGARRAGLLDQEPPISPHPDDVHGPGRG